MKVLNKSIKVENYFEKHLEIINPILPVQLTPKEIEVIAAFMALKGDLIDEDRFNTSARKHVMKNLNISLGGLSNYLRILIDKGFIYKENEVLKIREILFPTEGVQFYAFKLEDGKNKS